MKVKKVDRVLREILYRVYERNESFMSQKSLAQVCELSMDTANRLVSKLNQFRAIEKKPLGFRVVDPKKILSYWASTRNLASDVVYSTYSPDSVSKIESELLPESIFTAYSGYRLKFKETPTHYEEIFVYADPDEVRRKFPESGVERRNLYVLRQDPHLERVGKDRTATLAQLYIDLWQIGGATADRFILELEKRLEPRSIEALKMLARKGSS